MHVMFNSKCARRGYGVAHILFTGEQQRTFGVGNWYSWMMYCEDVLRIYGNAARNLHENTIRVASEYASDVENKDIEIVFRRIYDNIATGGKTFQEYMTNHAGPSVASALAREYAADIELQLHGHPDYQNDESYGYVAFRHTYEKQNGVMSGGFEMAKRCF